MKLKRLFRKKKKNIIKLNDKNSVEELKEIKENNISSDQEMTSGSVDSGKRASGSVDSGRKSSDSGCTEEDPKPAAKDYMMQKTKSENLSKDRVEFISDDEEEDVGLYRNQKHLSPTSIISHEPADMMGITTGENDKRDRDLHAINKDLIRNLSLSSRHSHMRDDLVQLVPLEDLEYDQDEKLDLHTKIRKLLGSATASTASLSRTRAGTVDTQSSALLETLDRQKSRKYSIESVDPLENMNTMLLDVDIFINSMNCALEQRHSFPPSEEGGNNGILYSHSFNMVDVTIKMPPGLDKISAKATATAAKLSGWLGLQSNNWTPPPPQNSDALSPTTIYESNRLQARLQAKINARTGGMLGIPLVHDPPVLEEQEIVKTSSVHNDSAAAASLYVSGADLVVAKSLAASIQTDATESISQSMQTEHSNNMAQSIQTDTAESVCQLVQTESNELTSRSIQTEMNSTLCQNVQTDDLVDQSIDLKETLSQLIQTDDFEVPRITISIDSQTEPPKTNEKSIQVEESVPLLLDQSIQTDTEKQMDEVDIIQKVLEMLKGANLSSIKSSSTLSELNTLVSSLSTTTAALSIQTKSTTSLILDSMNAHAYLSSPDGSVDPSEPHSATEVPLIEQNQVVADADEETAIIETSPITAPTTKITKTGSGLARKMTRKISKFFTGGK